MLLSILISSLHRSTTSSSPLIGPVTDPLPALPGLDSLTLSLLLVDHPPAARAGCPPILLRTPRDPQGSPGPLPGLAVIGTPDLCYGLPRRHGREAVSSHPSGWRNGRRASLRC
ncbi:hypothetical protein SCOCK_280111 [Actinacidiphila cocklensis]|uniref:Uncharacterized protein n=1 Tax=Actinacidiphila cocklensis TaxID=887465 RepID=A0A9W4DRD0_9ACTN|nr:hypothetical protein SCOCK_280111 [Actinacidiphila cocklensis]